MHVDSKRRANNTAYAYPVERYRVVYCF